MSLIESVKHGEGFRGRPYKDTLGFLTIGYGTKLPLDKNEAELILTYRLNKCKQRVNKNLGHLHIKKEAWNILYEMGYQLGSRGLLQFVNMIKALKIQDYKTAAKEGRDSKWRKQTPNRCNRLMDILESL